MAAAFATLAKASSELAELCEMAAVSANEAEDDDEWLGF